MCRKVLVKVRRKKAELAVWLFNHDVPVADQNGHWRGPIQPATGLTAYSALPGASSKIAHSVTYQGHTLKVGPL